MKNTTTILKIGKEFFIKNGLNAIFFILAMCVLLFAEGVNSKGPEIIFFDVGQGDAILIQQGDFQVLVDGGPDDGIVYKLAKEMPWYDKNVDIVVLTHPHEDHIRGLLNVLEEYTVGKVLFNRIDYEQKNYEYLLDNYDNLLYEVVEGDTFEYGDIFIEVIYPFNEERPQESNINNESVVLLAEIKNYRILLMGDAEKEVEAQLIGNSKIQNVYILKVGHHCSRTSSSEMFLNFTKPEIAICSCGERNKFGHPHYETIEKLENLNVQYLITYEEGDIVMEFDDL